MTKAKRRQRESLKSIKLFFACEATFDQSKKTAIKTMLSGQNIVAFVPTTDFERARAFYEGKLELEFKYEDGFALVLDANGIMLRIAKVPDFAPARFTILGWEVNGIQEMTGKLSENGVQFEHFGLPNQDDAGVWTAPSGDKVAWFKDPDGNILSLSEHVKSH